MKRALLATLLLAICGPLGACGDDTPDGDRDAAPVEDDGSGGTDTGDSDAGDVSPQPECDASLRPVVAAHGFLAAGDTWAPHAMRFEANGLCPGWFAAFDWNTLDRNADHDEALDALIDTLLSESGAAAVDLIGHSAGGGFGYEYLADPTRASRVAHYAHVGSFANDAPAGPVDAPVPTLNIWSPDDRTVEDGGDIPGATNVSLPGQDHYEVATSVESFEAMHRFFRDGADPTVTQGTATSTPTVSGRALTLGENEPEAGAVITVWTLDPETGQRATSEPVATLTTDDEGRWGPVTVPGDAPHEFLVEPADGVPVHYYREAFAASNPLVYLRTLPPPGTLAGILVSVLPLDTTDTVVVVFIASQALNVDEDSLTLDGLELSRDDTTDAANTTIAMFLYDANGNEQTDATVVDAFASFPFFAGVDVHVPGDAASTSELQWNERVIRFPRLPATDEGAIVVVFD